VKITKSNKATQGKDVALYDSTLPSKLKTTNSLMEMTMDQIALVHADYTIRKKEWTRIRDCMKGEDVIKSKRETYLPRPDGMAGRYSSAYNAYIERAHFPLICPYALSGALGVVITKLPEFNVPKELEYILKEATRDGKTLSQLFMDMVIEAFQTGRVPITVDVIPEKNEFRFVQYKAEDLTNWKSSIRDTVKSVAVAVLKEQSKENPFDIFATDQKDMYRVLHLERYTDPNDGVEKDIYKVSLFGENGENGFSREIVPMYLGKPLDEIPMFLAGSINNSFDIQPIPLISVANCSIQIYRKEADLANSEFLSCNPTLVVTGAMNDSNMPNVVGSSVMIVIPNEMARVFYTTTDTAALNHVKEHIKDLYEEAIRHGVSILDARKGVEAAEALRIRQATQSATLYSVYLSVLTAITSGLKMMCKWSGINPEEVKPDAPTSLTFGIPDSALIKELLLGFEQSGVIPIEIIHKYLVSSGLLEQTVSFEEYKTLLKENIKVKEMLGIDNKSKNKLDNSQQMMNDAGNGTTPKTVSTPSSEEIEESDAEKM
jgi:hypothetical protein